MNRVPIVYITDDNFIEQTCVSIYSLYENKLSTTHYDIYIIAATSDKTDLSDFGKFIKDDCSIKILFASTKDYEEIHSINHIPISCCLKFDISNLVPEDKVIYLDGDTIIQKDLFALYNIPLNGNTIGGVIQPGGKRINAGVMLMDLTRIDTDILKEKRISLGTRRSMDQELFNQVFKDDILYLPITYNYIPEVFTFVRRDETVNDKLVAVSQIYHKDYVSMSDLLDDVSIIHYATKKKPWNSKPKNYEIWKEYYNKTKRIIKQNT